LKIKISFYEEFPTKENLQKLKLIDFPCDLFAACQSIKEYWSLKKQLELAHPKVTVQFWPVLKASEGYWMSPFSDFKALKRTISEITKEKNKMRIVWDVELPRKKLLMLTNLNSFLKSKNLIDEFVRSSKQEILITENPVFLSIVGELFGVYFSPKKYYAHKTVMYYSSLIPTKMLREGVVEDIKSLHAHLGKRLSVGLGTIAQGVEKRPKTLTSQELHSDLSTMKTVGIEEVIIFRLGGLNTNYTKVLRNFI